jgi:anthranilate phosphoribosyltransferase
MDVCGTGGDGLKTFNISTLSSFVIAAAGGFVAKHGNRAVSSQAGSSDLMEALGIKIDIPYKSMHGALQKCGLGYFHAPFYHPSFAQVQKVRRELGIRTFFNMLGPLVNPLDIHYQMIGVSNTTWLEATAEMLKKLGRTRAAVFRSSGGLDELSTYESNDIFLIEKNQVQKMKLEPKKFGFHRARIQDYKGGTLETNKKIALGILEGRLQGPREDAVLLNSGFALRLTGGASSIKEGIQKSRLAVHSGRAFRVLEKLRKLTQQG